MAPRQCSYAGCSMTWLRMALNAKKYICRRWVGTQIPDAWGIRVDVYLLYPSQAFLAHASCLDCSARVESRKNTSEVPYPAQD